HPLPHAGPPRLRLLDQVITADKRSLLAQIPQEQGTRAITLKAVGDTDKFKADMLEIADKEKNNLPEDYTISTGGEDSDQQDFFAEIGVLFLIVLLIVYLVIAFHYNSFSLQFIDIFLVYLGFYVAFTVFF